MLYFYVNFGGDTGVIDIAEYCTNEFEIKEVYHNASYSAIKNTARFTIEDPSGTILKYFIDVADNFIPATVFIDSEVLFSGYIRNNFSVSTSTQIDQLQIELIDRSKELEVTLNNTINMTTSLGNPLYICDTAHPENSIIHQLLYEAGFGDAYAYGFNELYAYGFDAESAYGFASADFSALTDIAIEIDYYFKNQFDENIIYELIQEILKEAGYCLVVGVDGKPFFSSIIQRGEACTNLNISEHKIFNGFKTTRNDIKTNSVTGKYYEHELLEKAVVFNDETNGNEVYDCVIPLESGAVYPEDVNDPNTVSKLKFDIDGRDILFAKFDGAYVSYKPRGWFTLARPWSIDDWYGDSVNSGIKNSSPSTKNLLSFKVIADVIVKGPMHEYRKLQQGISVYNDEEIEFEYVYTQSVVENVVEQLLNNNIFGKYAYQFSSVNKLDLGAYYNITDDVFTNNEYSMKILTRTTRYYWRKRSGLSIEKYEYTGVSYGSLLFTNSFVANWPTKGAKGIRSVFRESNLDEGATTPTPPYEVGDIWIADDGVYEATTRKIDTQTYDLADWQKIETNQAYEKAVKAETVIASPNKLAALRDNPSTNYILFCAIDHTGIVHTDKPGVVAVDDRTLSIEDSSGNPISIELTLEGYNYIFFTPTNTLIAAQYDLNTMQLLSGGSAVPTSSICIAEILMVNNGTLSISTMNIFQEGKTLDIAIEYIKMTAFKVLSKATTASEWKSLAEGLGIQNAFTFIAGYEAFFTNLKSSNAWADFIQALDLAITGQIRSNYDISGNPTTPESAGFWLGSSGLLKARFAELLGTLRTGLGAATNARVAIQDQSGIISGPDFTGAGVNDLNIVTEGSVAGDIKVEIDSVDNVRVLGWKAVYLATALGFSDAGIVGANGASDHYNSKAVHAIGNTTSTNKTIYRISEGGNQVLSYTAPVSATYRFFTETENFSSGEYSAVVIKIDGAIVIESYNYNSSGGFTHDEDIYVSAGSTIEITLEESYRGSAYALVELVMTSFSSLFLFYDDDTSESISKDGSYRIATFLINGIDNTDIQDTYLTDTFRWTDDGGSSWTSGGDINISSPYSLSGYNIEIIFTQQDEHALGDYWEFSQGNMKGMSVRDSLGNEYFQLTNGTLFATSLVGQIAAYATSTVPDGWLECNGAAISRSAYSELFNAIGTTFGAGNGSTTFNIPDLRGEFIRGWDHSRGVDSGRSFGSYQPDTLQGHRHYSGYGTNNRNGRFGATSDGIRSHLDADWSYADNYTNGANTSTPVTDSTHGTPRIDSETKPRNRALMYCIKY